MDDYEIVPGRGLVTGKAIDLRLEYLQKKGLIADQITRYTLDPGDIQNNIESFIGAVEVPVGLVGPLLYQNGESSENVYCAAGTLEGALVASMNRGARAISLSGGFSAEVIHQKMVRAPFLLLTSKEAAAQFIQWVELNTLAIAAVAESYSNHAKLNAILPVVQDENVHLRFVYSTGDASGQNMTTSCTWHALLWIIENFERQTSYKILNFLVEGNAASDKKVSQFLYDHGRGIKVVARCILTENVMKKVLRTTPEIFLQFHQLGEVIAKRSGMFAYNINVANAIAAIFVATGQDLASVHESSIGEYCMKRIPEGLELSMTLPSLVIGTVGGGTYLPKQQECLKLMGCDGPGKVNRFAELIAGFTLGLDISTNAAIVSGEFAKAHEKLGRNKPIAWLQWNELNETFLKNCLGETIDGKPIQSITIHKGVAENGILSNITKKVNRKIIGFVRLDVELMNGEIIPILVKSKGTDEDVVKGIHMMAASVDPALSDLISANKNNLEYENCHVKELKINELLSKSGFQTTPLFYGAYLNDKREIYFLLQEYLLRDDLILIDSENSPEKWTGEHIGNAITAIHEIHEYFSSIPNVEQLTMARQFDASQSLPFYAKMIEIICNEYGAEKYGCLAGYLEDLSKGTSSLKLARTLVHNDFNPRNIAVRKDKRVCIYDWELATINYPHRDIIELMCFVLPENFSREELLKFLHLHFDLANKTNNELSWDHWKSGYSYAAKEFLCTRVSFYKTSEILMKLKFADRVMNNGIRAINFLNED